MKTIAEWKKAFPILQRIAAYEEVIWENPKYTGNIASSLFSMKDIEDAEKRLERFAPYIREAFPETLKSKGIIESELRDLEKMKRALSTYFDVPITGQLLLKCDSHLPISGSIKARGGIYEVLKYAEQLAICNGLLSEQDDYAVLLEEKFKDFFAAHSIAVGSTGNLGLSIGIIGAKLGFRVFVHMSADAKQWKKDLLREKGAFVVEHSGDFSSAVAEGRAQAEQDEKMYFIDDEGSKDLFLGYAVAALRVKRQLEIEGIKVDRHHPLFVYLPCGVGGGPGGVAYGLKQIFGEHVHCFFAEPTHSPSMLLGLLTGLHEKVSVYDFGLDNRTSADGLAVARPSGLVGRVMEEAISGVVTVEDRTLAELLKLLNLETGIFLEPSALAGFPGPAHISTSAYSNLHHLDLDNATHIMWATGGNMVPDAERASYLGD